jgi:hypothetical protein
VTSDSINSRVIRPLARVPGFRVSTHITLIRPQGPISNPLSGESGTVEKVLPTAFRDVRVDYLDQQDLVKTLKPVAKRLVALGDVYGDRGKSVEFALIYMTALRHSAAQVRDDTDVVIVLRPDVKIGGRLWVVMRCLLLAVRSRLSLPAVFAPAWGSFGGVNDRFAIMSGQLSQRYMTRIEKVPGWLEAGQPFDPEKFLGFALEGALVKENLYTPMFRIRLGGRLETADLAFFEAPAFVARVRNLVVKGAGKVRSFSDARKHRALLPPQ